MIKILFIHHAVGWGGAPSSMISLIKSLDRKKYEVNVLLLRYSVVADKLMENNIPYTIAQSTFYKKYYHYFIHTETGYVKWYQIFRFIRLAIIWLCSRYFFAAKELNKFSPDIIHLNSSVLTDWLKPSKERAKVILHIRESFRKGRIDILHYFFRNQMKKYADRIIAISRDNANRIHLPDKTTVIYNYANIPENPPNTDSFYSKKFLYLGGAAKIKGFYTLVKALDYLNIGTTIYFGGNYDSPKQKSKFKSIIKRFLRYDKKKEKAIYKMRNHRNAIEIGLTYKINSYLDDVCCLISPFSKPHFSRPVIEAHLHRKPVIGSDVGGMDEIVADGENGLLFKKEDAVELANSINYIASHPEEANRMGYNGYRVAIRKFTQENIKMVEAVYNELINK